MKRHLPLFSLIIVSALVCLCALGVVFVLSVDAITVEEKIQAMLTLGLPSALALVVLLWFGAGMDQFLSRLKNKSTRVGVSLLTYILVPIMLCIGLPALAALVIYGVFNAPKGWQQLPAPPQPAEEVAAAGEVSVTVRTVPGDYYFCGVSAPSECWQATDEPEQKLSGRGTETDILPSFEPPGEAVSLLGLSYSDTGAESRSYYAVLRDGSVWYLQQNNNTYESGFASGLFLTITLLPALFGLIVIYLGAGVSALARWASYQGNSPG